MFAANPLNTDPHAGIKFLQKYEVLPKTKKCLCGEQMTWSAVMSEPDGRMKCNSCGRRETPRARTALNGLFFFNIFIYIYFYFLYI